MIRTFNYNQLNLNMQTIAAGGEIYFKAKEVASALGYSNHRDALARHVPDQFKGRFCDIKGVVKRDSC